MKLFPVGVDSFHFTAAVTVATLGFLIYYYFTSSRFAGRILNLPGGVPKQVLYQRFTGVLIFGCIPAVLILLSGSQSFAESLFGSQSFAESGSQIAVESLPGSKSFTESLPVSQSFAEYGITSAVPGSYYWTLILSLIIIPMNYFNAGTSMNLEMYPQIRSEQWSIQLLLLSALSWILYLLAYEFLFRGYLLFTAIPIMGLWPAIIFNTVIYSLVHSPKGYKEMLGAIPLGFLLCYLTFITGSIWTAVFTHIIMALSNEWFSLRKHPGMVIKMVWR